MKSRLYNVFICTPNKCTTIKVKGSTQLSTLCDMIKEYQQTYGFAYISDIVEIKTEEVENEVRKS